LGYCEAWEVSGLGYGLAEEEVQDYLARIDTKRKQRNLVEALRGIEKTLVNLMLRPDEVERMFQESL
jgi:hypothetical protein